MTVSNELMLAILAMDSYNRGYDAGIGDGQNVVDGVDVDGLGEAGSTIGSAVVLNFSVPQGSQAAGFYAVDYQWNGETVISYRGTDNGSIWGNPWSSPGDICSGWPLGGGTRRPRPRHPRAPTKKSAATSLPLGSIPLSHRTMLQVEGSRNGSSARGPRRTKEGADFGMAMSKRR
ncbi:MAG: hypothetical protein U1A06_11805 [Hoeflea sp.]|nr:hypothetical protein [Hoeflea sp.]